MLTVKFLKYGPKDADEPSYTELVSVRSARSVHVKFDARLRSVVQINDAPGSDTIEVTVGKDECEYSVAYIMNDAGRTIETIR